MKTISPLFVFLVLVSTTLFSFAGERIPASRIILRDIETQQIYAVVTTNETGGFGIIDIEKGNYLIEIEIPTSALTAAPKDSLHLNQLINGGCDKEQGRLIFKYKYNCFVFDLDCEIQKGSEFQPAFLISENDGKIRVNVATVQVTERSTFKGIFQRLTGKFYERCFSSNSFQILVE